MRSKVLVIFTAALLFGLGIAVYAYNTTPTNAETTAASKSCCGDSCPMKSKDAKASGESTNECCCKGGADSCPMKSKDAKHGDKMAMSADKDHSCPMMSGKHEGMAGHDTKHDMKMANGESCPMMKDGKTSEMHKGLAGMDHSAHAKSGESCCACCSHNKEKKDTTAKGAI